MQVTVYVKSVNLVKRQVAHESDTEGLAFQYKCLYCPVQFSGAWHL